MEKTYECVPLNQLPGYGQFINYTNYPFPNAHIHTGVHTHEHTHTQACTHHIKKANKVYEKRKILRNEGEQRSVASAAAHRG